MKRPSSVPNLRDIPFSQALDLAKALSGKTNEQIAEETKLGIETIRRFFKDPTYSPAPWRLPKLCEVLGNTILVEWLAVNTGGMYVTAGSMSPGSLDMGIAHLTREFSDVLREDGAARLDNRYSDEELSRIELELAHLLNVGHGLAEMIKSQRRQKA